MLCVFSLASYVLHIGAMESGALRVGDTVSVRVNYDRRSEVAPNHTMTHVLNYALRTVRWSETGGLSRGGGLGRCTLALVPFLLPDVVPT